MRGGFTAFLPFPHVFQGVRSDGFGAAWPAICVRCPHRECESNTNPSASVCRRGVGYRWIAPDLMVGGLVIRGAGLDKRFSREAVKRGGAVTVRAEVLDEASVLATEILETEHQAERDQADLALQRLRREPEFVRELIAYLRPNIQQALAQTHDYQQFVAAILQHLNVWWENQGSGGEIANATEPASLLSIYHAARLMESRLTAHRFLDRPSAIRDGWARIQIFRMFDKFVKLYAYAARTRNVSIEMVGGSFRSVLGNYEAVGLIPQALLDNAVKYAPHGSPITVTFDDSPRQIVVAVASYGPEVEPDEMKTIFEPFERGRHTGKYGQGMGLGLGMVALVCQTMGWHYEVAQDKSRTFKGCFKTTFTVEFLPEPR